MHSCIYQGRVSHARSKPARHQFSYRLFMMYLDLDELPGLFHGRWLWSSTRPALARFRRADHLGPVDQPLIDSVRDLVAAQTGRRPEGPVRLLTNLSFFGYRFNPVSFYYCFARDGETVETIVAEVNNTPWGEQDCYVLPCGAGDDSRSWRFHPDKKMHVSPFMPMDVDYDWALTQPTQNLAVKMASAKHGEQFFCAAMAMRRKEITTPALAGVLLRFPFTPLKIMFAIHWQALRLWIKRVPFYPHPRKRAGLASRKN